MNKNQCNNLGGEWKNNECRIKEKVTLGTDALLESARSLVREGIITKEQFREMEERNRRLPSDKRKTIIDFEEKPEMQKGGKDGR